MDNARGAWDLPRVRARWFFCAVAIGFAFVFTGAIVLFPRSARAEDGGDVRAAVDVRDVRTRAEEIFQRAEREDAELRFADALAHYDEGRAIDPGSPRAPRAEARAAILRSHDEGDFVPFTKLEKMRRDPAQSSDVRAVEQLVEDAEKFPMGLVRVEVWVLAAEAFAHRFGRPLEAETLLLRVIGDPRTDPVIAQKAARDATALQLERRDFARAKATVTLAAEHADDRLAADVRRAEQRRRLHHASIAVLVGMVLLAGWAAIEGSRSDGGKERIVRAVASTWRLAVGYAVYVSVTGAMLASGYEAGTGKPFLWFGVVLVPVLLLARMWGAAGAQTGAARGGRAWVAGLAAVAAAFLVLEGVDVAFLDGMGL